MAEFRFPRGELLQRASAAAAALVLPRVTVAEGALAAGDQLNLAFVGVGGRGRASVEGLAVEHHVAYGDGDDARAAGTCTKNPGVPRFRAERDRLDQLGRPSDAGVVATPERA